MSRAFQNLIGQEKAKKKLNFYLEGAELGQPIPSLFFSAPKGAGKTSFAEEFARNVKDRQGNRRKYLEVNCANIGAPKEFAIKFLPRIQDKEVTVLFDEIHQMDSKLQMALLSGLNPGGDRINTVDFFGDYFTFNLNTQTFMAATTEPDKVFHALRNRFQEVQLKKYTVEEIAQIIELNLDADAGEEILLDIASCMRLNARNAVQTSMDLLTMMKIKQTNEVDAGLWADFRDVHSIYPLGLAEKEIELLGYLMKGERTLTSLASSLEMTRSAVQQDIELFLVSNGLMEIDGKRKITQAGRNYMQAL